DAGAGGHALHLARTDRGAVAETVFVFERAVEDVADDLHVAVTVGAEALPRRHAVLVDHAQAAEAHMPAVPVAAEREGVAAVEPAQFGPAAFVVTANGDHCLPPTTLRDCRSGSP